MKIKEIYSGFINSPEYVTIVNESGIDKKHFAALSEIESLICKELYLDFESQIEYIDIEREEFGFINGFKLAMQIMTDCVPEVVKQKAGDVV